MLNDLKEHSIKKIKRRLPKNSKNYNYTFTVRPIRAIIPRKGFSGSIIFPGQMFWQVKLTTMVIKNNQEPFKANSIYYQSVCVNLTDEEYLMAKIIGDIEFVGEYG